MDYFGDVTALAGGVEGFGRVGVDLGEGRVGGIGVWGFGIGDGVHEGAQFLLGGGVQGVYGFGEVVGVGFVVGLVVDCVEV